VTRPRQLVRDRDQDRDLTPETETETRDTRHEISNFARIFADKYQDLYNSVPYDIKTICDIRDELAKRISLNGYNEDYCIFEDDVTTATRKLKLNKYDGGRGLFTNHFKHGSNDLAMHTANLIVLWYSDTRVSYR